MNEELQKLEKFWRFELPEKFALRCEILSEKAIPTCHFFKPAEIIQGAGRTYGMLPQYLPFAKTENGDGLFGFFMTSERSEGTLPVVYWDEEEMFLRPVSTDFDCFLANRVLTSVYQEHDLSSEDRKSPDILKKTSEVVRALGLEPTLLSHRIPENDTELAQRLAGIDPQDSVSLCHLGCSWRSKGEEERALDFFHRATEATTWFGDADYLLADIYRVRENWERATEGWWRTVNKLIPLCTRTWEWDLGEDHPDAEIYEIAADALVQFGKSAAPHLRSSPLWKAVTQDDPYDPDVREALSLKLKALKDFDGMERELLNTLTLCFADRGKQAERIYDNLQAHYELTGQEREAAMIRLDRTLPRPGR